MKTNNTKPFAQGLAVSSDIHRAICKWTNSIFRPTIPTNLIDKCVERKSFEQSIISSLIDLDEVGLLYREDIKNMQGKEQRNEIYRYLKNSLLREVPEQNEYKF